MVAQNLSDENIVHFPRVGHSDVAQAKPVTPRGPQTAEEVLAWQPPAPGSIQVSDYAEAKVKNLLTSDKAYLLHRARIRVPGYTDDIPGLGPEAQDQARRASSMRWVHDQRGTTPSGPDVSPEGMGERPAAPDAIDVRSLEVGKLESGRLYAGKISKSAGIPCPTDLVATTTDGALWALAPAIKDGGSGPIVHLRGSRARLTIPTSTLGILGLRDDSAVLIGSAPGLLILMPLSKFGITICRSDVA